MIIIISYSNILLLLVNIDSYSTAFNKMIMNLTFEILNYEQINLFDVKVGETFL
jgi:hypothetical protein